MKIGHCIILREDSPEQLVAVQCILANRRHFKDKEFHYTTQCNATAPPHIKSIKAKTAKELFDELAKKYELCIVQNSDSILNLKFWESIDHLIKDPRYIGAGYSPADIVPIRAPHHRIDVIKMSLHAFTTVAINGAWWKQNRHLFPDGSLDNDEWFKVYTLILTQEGSFIGNKKASIFRCASSELETENSLLNEYPVLKQKWEWWLDNVLYKRRLYAPFKYERFYELGFFNESHEKLQIPQESLDILRR